jgi:hypothetical protein
METFTIEYEGKTIRGQFLILKYSFSVQILINKYFYGDLVCRGLDWEFENGKSNELANLIGDYVMAWLE